MQYHVNVIQFAMYWICMSFVACAQALPFPAGLGITRLGVKNGLSVVRGKMMFLDLGADRITDKIVCVIGNCTAREVRGDP